MGMALKVVGLHWRGDLNSFQTVFAGFCSTTVLCQHSRILTLDCVFLLVLKPVPASPCGQLYFACWRCYLKLKEEHTCVTSLLYSVKNVKSGAASGSRRNHLGFISVTHLFCQIWVERVSLINVTKLRHKLAELHLSVKYLLFFFS